MCTYVFSQLDDDRAVASPSGESNDSGIQADVTSHVRGPVNDDLYAVVNKQKAADDVTSQVRLLFVSHMVVFWSTYGTY